MKDTTQQKKRTHKPKTVQCCQECPRPGDRYLLDGQYLYFCEYHVGYFALLFLQYSQGNQQSGGDA